MDNILIAIGIIVILCVIFIKNNKSINNVGMKNNDEKMVAAIAETNMYMTNSYDDDVDPVAEADVYMAYGRNNQALNILRKALLENRSPEMNQRIEKKINSIMDNSGSKNQRNSFLKQDAVAEDNFKNVDLVKKYSYKYYINWTVYSNSYPGNEVRTYKEIYKAKNAKDTEEGILEIESFIESKTNNGQWVINYISEPLK